MDTTTHIVPAVRKGMHFYGPSETRLTLAKSLTKMQLRQLKNVIEGDVIMVRVDETTIIEILQDDEKDRRDTARKEKTEAIEEFRKLLHGEVNAVIRQGTTFHELPDGEDRITHFHRMLAANEEEIVSPDPNNFQIQFPGKIKVTGKWKVVASELRITITHYGEGSFH